MERSMYVVGVFVMLMIDDSYCEQQQSDWRIFYIIFSDMVYIYCAQTECINYKYIFEMILKITFYTIKITNSSFFFSIYKELLICLLILKFSEWIFFYLGSGNVKYRVKSKIIIWLYSCRKLTTLLETLCTPNI